MRSDFSFKQMSHIYVVLNLYDFLKKTELKHPRMAISTTSLKKLPSQVSYVRDGFRRGQPNLGKDRPM